MPAATMAIVEIVVSIVLISLFEFAAHKVKSNRLAWVLRLGSAVTLSVLGGLSVHPIIGWATLLFLGVPCVLMAWKNEERSDHRKWKP